MFARTERLTLRPGWPEDAPELVRAIAHEAVVHGLSEVPWPYALGDARDFLERDRSGADRSMLIYAHHPDAVRLVGGIGLKFDGAAPGEAAIGYWLTPGAWGRGYATEAGRAVIANARHTLRLRTITARAFVDNAASTRVLARLGFRATGEIVPVHSRARGTSALAMRHVLDLDSAGATDDVDRGRIAA